MNKVNIISLLLLGLGVFAQLNCRRPEYPPLIPRTGTKLFLDTLWTSSNGYSFKPILNVDSNVLVSEMYTPEGDIIKLLDKNSGGIIWEWNDYLEFEEGFEEGHRVVRDDIMVIGRNKNTYALNIKTGKTVWRHSMAGKCGEPWLFMDEAGYVYKGYSDCRGNYKSYIYRTKFDQGIWELVCSYEDSAKAYNINYCTPLTFVKNEKGEQLLIYTLYQANTKFSITPISKILCLNMNQNRFEWIREYTNIVSEFSVVNMLSNDEMVYTYAIKGSKFLMLAIRVKDGSLAWIKELPDFGVKMHLYKGNIITQCNGKSPVSCFNQKTGALVWKQSFSPTALSPINFDFEDALVFKNYLFSTQCDYLLVLNLDNGEVVYNEDIALPEGCLQYGIAINELRRTFYVQDRRRILCYPLPKEIVF